jgi:SAM-dependent methyltransferase
MAIDTTHEDLTIEEERAADLAERLNGQFNAGVELLTVELGRRLGLYDVLAAAGAVTAAELAERAAIAPRYALEWLDQQAAAGILDVVAADATTGDRRFVLPAGHTAVLLAPDSPAYLMGAAPLLLGVARALPAVADAYATARGVEYAEFGDELRLGIADLNRPGYANDVRAWVEELPDIAARLDRGGVVLDAGCGEGWSTIGLARAFPAATVVGVDLDEESVTVARHHVAQAGLQGRVTVVHANTADAEAVRSAAGDQVTLVTAFEALHDMGEPVRALAVFRDVLVDGGAVLVADHLGDDVKAAPAGEVERMQLAMSVLHCLPATWAESDHVVNGTVLRTATLVRWVRESGFDGCDLLDVEHPFWRFYRVD